MRTRSDKLRRQAEERLKGVDKEIKDFDLDNMKALIHEFSVQQEELKIQNEELRRAQLETEEERDRYSQFYDFAPVGFLTLSDKGLILEANLTFTSFIGIERKGLIHKPITNYIDTNDQDVFYLTSKKIYKTKSKQTCELKLLNGSGGSFYVTLECAPIWDDDDNISTIRVVVVNIDDSKKADQKYQNVLDNSPDFMFESRIDNFQFTRVNSKACEFYGFSESEFLKMNIFDIEVNPPLKSELRMAYDNLPIGVVTEITGHNKKKDGSIFPVNVRLSKINNDFAIASARDISSQMKNEESLRQFKMALDESALVSIADTNGIITYVNQQFIDISKYSKEELVGSDHSIINSGKHSKGFFTDLWKTISKGKIWKGVIQNKSKEGRYYWVSSTIIPILNSDGRPAEYIAIRFDITKQKLIEQELAEKYVDLDRFSSVVSHDLKTPLRGMHNLVEFMEADIPKLSEDSTHKFGLIKNRVKRLNNLIDGLLEYSKIGKEEKYFEETPVSKLISNAIDTVGIKKEVQITVDGEIPDFTTNPLLLNQLFSNLISNAIKHNDKAEVYVKIIYSDIEDYHVFRVADNGPGISENMRGKVFEIFQTVKTKDDHDSTGIGLALVQKIASELKGSITIEDNVPEGAIFVFSHPKVLDF